jgi:thiol-disulfide isomerase/thioredoxin
MEKLTEATFAKAIKDNDKLIIKGWQDNCSWCDEYAPIFAEAEKKYPKIKFAEIKIQKDGPSEFRRTYMKADKGEQLGAPMTFLFVKGEMVMRHYGKLELHELEEMVNINLKDYTLAELYAIKGEAHTLIEIAQEQLKLNEAKFGWANRKIVAQLAISGGV